MEPPLLSETFGRKLYSKRGIMIATLIGGPLAGGYLLAKNLKIVNQHKKTGQIWAIATAALLGLVAFAIIVPEYVPNFLFFFFMPGWDGLERKNSRV